MYGTDYNPSWHSLAVVWSPPRVPNHVCLSGPPRLCCLMNTANRWKRENGAQDHWLGDSNNSCGFEKRFEASGSPLIYLHYPRHKANIDHMALNCDRPEWVVSRFTNVGSWLVACDDNMKPKGTKNEGCHAYERVLTVNGLTSECPDHVSSRFTNGGIWFWTSSICTIWRLAASGSTLLTHVYPYTSTRPCPFVPDRVRMVVNNNSSWQVCKPRISAHPFPTSRRGPSVPDRVRMVVNSISSGHVCNASVP